MSESTFGGYATETEPTSNASAAPAEAVAGLSIFDEILQEADVEQDFEEFFNVRGRDGITVSFNTDIGSRDIKRWADLGQGKRKRSKDADQRLIAGSCIVERNTGIYKNGVQAVDGTGEPLTFRHKAFIDTYAKDVFVKTAIDAVVKFMGEGQMFSMNAALYELAGFGDDIAPWTLPTVSRPASREHQLPVLGGRRTHAPPGPRHRDGGNQRTQDGHPGRCGQGRLGQAEARNQ